MDEEKLLKLAKRISNGLPEVTRSEWMRWTQIAQIYGLERAIEIASKLGDDITLRPAIKHSNELIARTMNHNYRDFSNLKATEQRNLLGYVSWILIVESKSQSSKRKSEDRYNEPLVV